MPSSSAALVKLPWRAAASKARTAERGGSLVMTIYKRGLCSTPDNRFVVGPCRAQIQRMFIRPIWPHNTTDEEAGAMTLLTEGCPPHAPMALPEPWTRRLLALMPRLNRAPRAARLDPDRLPPYLLRDLGLADPACRDDPWLR